MERKGWISPSLQSCCTYPRWMHLHMAIYCMSCVGVCGPLMRGWLLWVTIVEAPLCSSLLPPPPCSRRRLESERCHSAALPVTDRQTQGWDVNQLLQYLWSCFASQTNVCFNLLWSQCLSSRSRRSAGDLWSQVSVDCGYLLHDRCVIM